MKFETLELQNFGKFHNKELQFQDGINLIYGPNEAGKTTVYQSLKGMLFGMDKKGRAKHDPYTVYEPWENVAYYAGILRFVSGGKRYRVERSFQRSDKRAVLVCEDTGEELPVEEISRLIGGITESSYSNTMSVGQMSVEPDEGLAGAIKNYAANYYGTGSGSIDVVRVQKSLREKHREAEKKLETYLEKRAARQHDMEQQEELLTNSIDRDQYSVKAKTVMLQEMDPRRAQLYENRERFTTELAEKNALRTKLDEDEDAAQVELARFQERLDRETRIADEERKAYQEALQLRDTLVRRKRLTGMLLLIAGILSLAVGLTLKLVFSLRDPLWMLLPIIGILLLVIGILIYAGAGRLMFPREPEDRRETLTKLTSAVRSLTEHLQKLHDAMEQTDRGLRTATLQRDALGEQLMELDRECNCLKGQISQLKSDISEQQIEHDILKEQLEELRRDTEKQRQLAVDSTAYKAAAMRIADLAEHLRAQFGRSLNRRASQILAELTAGKYESLVIDEKLNMHLNTPKKRIPVEEVSRGTMDQVYLALRMAALEVLFPEEMPVILDDTFVYYDDKRLESTLQWFAAHKKQVLLFTCQSREEQILKRSYLPYHKLALQED